MASTFCWVDCRRHNRAFARFWSSRPESEGQVLPGYVRFRVLPRFGKPTRFRTLPRPHPNVLFSRTCERYVAAAFTRPCRLRTGSDPNDDFLPCNRSRPGSTKVFRQPIPVSTPRRLVGPETGLPQQRSASVRIDPRAVRISAVDTADLDPPSRV